MSKDKYERAMQQTPLAAAFAGTNLSTQLPNLKNMVTVAKNEMQIKTASTCQDHLDLFTAAVGMHWPNMLQAAWAANRNNAVAIKDMKVPIPSMNWMFWAGRRAIEYVEPRVKTTDAEAFGKCFNFDSNMFWRNSPSISRAFAVITLPSQPTRNAPQQ